MSTTATSPYDFKRGSSGSRMLGAGAAIALHVALGTALMSYEPARSALFAPAPIMVELITPPKAEPKPKPPVEIIPPEPNRKPKPKREPVVKPRPKLAEPPPPVVSSEVAAPVTAPPPPTPPEPEPVPEPVVAAPPPPPVPVSAPVFNADYLKNPPPAYPSLSRRLGEEGRVILRVLVNPSGTADEVQVRDSSGHERLDRAAREAVQRWRFVPAKRGEQPISAWVLIPISFRLES